MKLEDFGASLIISLLRIVFEVTFHCTVQMNMDFGILGQ